MQVIALGNQSSRRPQTILQTGLLTGKRETQVANGLWATYYSNNSVDAGYA
jgi:hypothetical protein